MDAEYKPVPLRCVLMTISMGVLLILLFAGPACTHKNKGSKPQDASVTSLPLLEIPVFTPQGPDDSTSEHSHKKISMLQRPLLPSRESWMLLLENNDHAANRKRKSQGNTLRPRRPGPVGPPAPPRHHSHLSKSISQEKRLQHLLHLLSELLLRRQNGEHAKEHKHLTLLPPKVQAAFTCRTNKDTTLELGDQQELQPYQWPQEEGSFYRGAGLNLTSGRYTAPFYGLYTFIARLKIDFEETVKIENPEGFLHVQLCIQSLCQQNLSLQQVRRITGNEFPYTVNLNGILYLKAGQYVSIFLENRMGYRLVVQKGSDFSGMLLGR